jgi:hypothetical protein
MLDKIKNWFFSSKTDLTNVKNFSDEKRSISKQIKRYNYRVEASLKKWKQAIEAAEDNQRPNREEMYLLYHRIMEDDQLLAQVRTARFNIQMGDFEVMVNNTNSEDLVKLFDTPWFFKYLEMCVDTELYGYSLIEPRRGDDGFVKEIILVPREHVDPLKKQIILMPSDDDGVSWEEDPLLGRLIAIGDADDLGLLKAISKLVIRKDYNLGDWGRRNERFGIPFITMKTASQNKTELDAKQEMLENFGASGWALIDDLDTIEIKEAMGQTGGGHVTFEKFLEYADKCIAFLVNGTTASSEQVAYAGNAEVQERQLNKYTLARMRRIQYHINFDLFPFLATYFDYPIGEAKFEFVDLRKNEGKENNAADNNTDTKAEVVAKTKK